MNNNQKNLKIFLRNIESFHPSAYTDYVFSETFDVDKHLQEGFRFFLLNASICIQQQDDQLHIYIGEQAMEDFNLFYDSDNSLSETYHESVFSVSLQKDDYLSAIQNFLTNYIEENSLAFWLNQETPLIYYFFDCAFEQTQLERPYLTVKKLIKAMMQVFDDFEQLVPFLKHFSQQYYVNSDPYLNKDFSNLFLATHLQKNQVNRTAALAIYCEEHIYSFAFLNNNSMNSEVYCFKESSSLNQIYALIKEKNELYLTAEFMKRLNED